MQYKYCERNNFEDLSCGKVIIYKSGFTNFPVRLAEEIFHRCLEYCSNKTNICIYDPCCGGGYLLTVLGFLNINIISKIIASDVNEEALIVARDNLSLLGKKGLKNRINKLNDLYSLHKKNSYLEALDSGNRMMEMLKCSQIDINIELFNSDILIHDSLVKKNFTADIIIADVPYGNLVKWSSDIGVGVDKTNIFLENLLPVVNKNSVVAICSDKKQKFASPFYQKLEKQLIGKRKFEIFKPIIQ